ncbi:MAG: Slp family lipoprotein [Desulfobacteraceae bacterium]|nr:Slp family lipoprotein [Desulfobacteraceae bacterium]
MIPSITKGLLAASFVIYLVGCGGISKEARSQVTYTGTFAELQASPDPHIGQIAIFGGKVISVQVLDKGTELTILQLELDSSDRPMNNDQSKGRFLVLSNQFLDPALYPAGTLVTVVGKIKGSQERAIGQMPYRYPIIEPIEIKKWPMETDTSPRFHFGIGVGKTF